MIDAQQPRLRDVILVEADALNMQADMLEKLAGSGIARAVLERRLQVHAKGCRQRASALNLILALTQPEATRS